MSEHDCKARVLHSMKSARVASHFPDPQWIIVPTFILIFPELCCFTIGKVITCASLSEEEYTLIELIVVNVTDCDY